MRTNRFRHAFAAATLVAACAVPALAAAPDLKPFNADYIANYMGMEGAARMSLAPAGASWTYTLSVKSSLATLSQSTTFDENGGQWRPLSGTDNSNVLIKSVKKQATYDWAKGVATWTGDVKADRAGPVKLQAGDLDAMLVNLAIARDVAAGKPLGDATLQLVSLEAARWRVDLHIEATRGLLGFAGLDLQQSTIFEADGSAYRPLSQSTVRKATGARRVFFRSPVQRAAPCDQS